MDAAQQNKTRASNIRAVWEALLAPKWGKDDLIDLGKAIYARKSLKDIDPRKFDGLLPHLIAIVEVLEARFAPSHPTDASPPTEIPGNVTLVLKTKERHDVAISTPENKENPAVDVTSQRKE